MSTTETQTTETEQEHLDDADTLGPSKLDEPTPEPEQVGRDFPPDPETGEEPETFPRSYVEELRQENGKYRQRAQRADDLAAALWAARVAATGRLADPSDLPLPEDVDPLDADAVTTAVEDLLATKPHLASRRPRGDVGQGSTGTSTGVDLAGILRSRA